MHVDGSPSSFQFKKARFSGSLPLKSFEITFASNAHGCSPVKNAKGTLLVVQRGECTYLEKAIAADAGGAAGLVVVNTDNGDLFEMPAGYDLTMEELEVSFFFFVRGSENMGDILRELTGEPCQVACC